jgi:hypothetical protein
MIVPGSTISAPEIIRVIKNRDFAQAAQKIEEDRSLDAKESRKRIGANLCGDSTRRRPAATTPELQSWRRFLSPPAGSDSQA